ncbi:hypothetical protein O181_006798 [Austropuccinia psidii MF-1]|uniref:Uncharacterized protein n=1 Tax=Austropuccinia psidii MF-1 TaxID=1389203 RepID=A0A9Q3BL57_9BASI|nr:hypothetical protein [Austropuccinia psidii MF-1]
MDWVTGLVPGGKENFYDLLVIVDGYRKFVRSPTGLQHKPPLYHREITLIGRKRVDHWKKNLLAIHPTAKDFHYIWKRECDTAGRCIAEGKDYNKQSYDKTHMEPDFKEGEQVLVSAPNFNNLKGPKKMGDSLLGPLTIIKLIGENAVEVRLTEKFSRKHLVVPVSLVKPYF